MSSLPPISAVGRHADVGEADVGRPRALLAHLGVLDADLDARGVRGHQEDRDARAVVVGGPAAGEDDEQIGDRGVGDEPLVPVDDPVRVVL